MEFVLVTFPRVRPVVMDGAPQGSTGQVIGVQAGHHDFDLGDPQDYVPQSIQAAIAGTTPEHPRVIAFQPAVVLTGAPATRRAAKGARKKGKKKVQRKRTARKAAPKRRVKKTAKKKTAKKTTAKKTRRRR